MPDQWGRPLPGEPGYDPFGNAGSGNVYVPDAPLNLPANEQDSADNSVDVPDPWAGNPEPTGGTLDGYTWDQSYPNGVPPPPYDPGLDPTRVGDSFDAGWYQDMTPEERQLWAITNEARAVREQNRKDIDAGIGEAKAHDAYADQVATQADLDRIGRIAQTTDGAAGRDAGALAALRGSADAANDLDYRTLDYMHGAKGASDELDLNTLDYMHQATGGAGTRDAASIAALKGGQREAAGMDFANLGELRTAMGAADAEDDATVNRLSALNSGMREITPEDWGAPVTSRAGAVTGDDESTAMQRTASNFMLGTAAGQNDIDSEAARAQADARDVAMQRGAGDLLLQTVHGGSNIGSDVANVTPDQRALQIQNLATDRYAATMRGNDALTSDAARAAADPDSIEGQKWALQEMRDRSDPTLSAQERYMMELARQREEQDRKSATQAALRDLKVRGQGGSGAEVGALLGAQQITSQNRMLQDMAAQANAVARAEANLGRAGTLSSGIRNQSFGEDMSRREAADAMSQSNRNVLLNAVDRYASQGDTQREQSFSEGVTRAQAADEAARGNRDVQQEAIRDYTGLSTAMRGQGFDESLSRGTAADAAAVGNRDARTGAVQDYAGLSSGMRDQAYTEDMGAATASDAMDQFNKTQSTAYQQWENEFQQAQQAAQWGRGLDETGVRTDATAAQAGRAGATYDAGRDTVDANYNRYADANEAERAATADDFARKQTTAGVAQDVADGAFGRAESVGNTATGTAASTHDRNVGVTGAYMGANQQDWDRRMTGENEVEQATDDFTNRQIGQGDRATAGAALKTGQYSGDSGAVQQGEQLTLGKMVNDKASATLNEEGGFDLRDPFTWFQ